MLFGEVLHFGTIRGDVVEFPFSSHALGNELPITIANSTVTLVLEEDGLTPFEGLTLENWDKGSSFNRNLILRLGGLGEIKAGSH